MADREATEFAKFTTTPSKLGATKKVNGEITVLHDTLVFSSGDAIADKGFAFKIPSSAMILPSSMVYHEGAGTGVTLNLGDATSTAGLASLVDVSAAGSFSALEAVAVDDYAKPVWEMLGYSEDPKALLDVFYTIRGAATGAAATFVHEIFYV